MDSLSSSFISSLPTSHTLPKSAINVPKKLSTIYAVSIEERPQTQNPRTRNPNPSPKLNSPSSSSSSTKPSHKNTTFVAEQRSISPSFSSLILNTFSDIVDNFIDPPSRHYVDPKHVLTSNFAPVDELPPTPCEVVFGSLPSCLDGAYIRNGPNPQFLPRGPYHLFDGDGMLHCIKISDGAATLCSRYVKTYKFKTEKDAGAPVFPKVFSGFSGLVASAARGAIFAGRIAAGQYNPANGIGNANTSLAFFGDRLFALGESDLPYEVSVTEDGDVVTLGRCDFDGKLFMSMTAHPKVDPDSGETFAYRYGPVPPFLTYFRFDSTGKKQSDVPIFSMGQPSLLHDFAITKKYVIFPDMQIAMNPMEMISGGSPVAANPGKVPRIGVLPRYAKDESEIKWFNIPGFNAFHAINAWEEDDGETIAMVAPNILTIEHALERIELVHAMVEIVRVNLKTGIISRQPISARNLDFAVVNPAYLGKKNKYVYAGVGDPMPKFCGVAKLDISNEDEKRDCTVACRVFGEGCYGGEPFFVAKEGAVEEDDGYVVSYVHNEKKGESTFVVMDAQSPELGVVAEVKLPRRVPYGFHGLFVKDSDLRKV